MDESSKNFGLHEDDRIHREFMRLVVSNQNKINAFILCMVPRQRDAEDILQDALAEMWKKFDQFEKGTNFTAWGCTIAKFKILNYRRKQKNSKVQFSDKLLEIVQNESQERICTIETRIDKLKECIRRLTPKQTKVLRLRYDDDMTFREIAKIYGYSHQAVYRSMGVIHSLLVKCLNKGGAHHG